MEKRAASVLAGSLGPGGAVVESEVVGIKDGGEMRGYSGDVKERTKTRSGWGNTETESLRYYCDGLAFGRWKGASEEEKGREGKPKRPVKMIWGKKDPALDWRVCADGVEEWSRGTVKVRFVERVGHWVPLDERGVEVIAEEIVTTLGEKGD